MFKTSLRTLAAGVALGCAVLPAQAALFDFSYTALDGGLIHGQLSGDLQPDANTLLVTAVTAQFNADPPVPLPIVTSGAFFVGLPPTPAFVTLDGAEMSLLACTDAACVDGFLLDTVYAPLLFGIPMMSSGVQFGSYLEPYDSTRWRIAQVPEPSVLALLGLGIGLLARRRKTA